ncbi:MAG: hypothetical protein ABJF01_07535 [bacterium]
MPSQESQSPGLGMWLLQLVMIVITSVLVLQNTKQALLPAKQTPLLWIAELVTIAGVLFLRSGWGRDTKWADEQAQLGTLANNFYEPRRDALISGTAIGLGVLGALWWALATWGLVFTGMRRGVPGRALIDFQVAALVGAITGGVVGAALGLVVGHFWEKRHRRQRLARQTRHA